MGAWLTIAGAVLQIILAWTKRNGEELKNAKAELDSLRKQKTAAADTAHLAADRDALADRVRDKGL